MSFKLKVLVFFVILVRSRSREVVTDVVIELQSEEDKLIVKKYAGKAGMRIRGGAPAARGDVPYQVAFKRKESYYSPYTSRCGGTIIKESVIVSAAHCFENDQSFCCKKGYIKGSNVRHIYAVAGSTRNAAHYSNNDGQWRRLDYIKYPESYDFPYDDIALVKGASAPPCTSFPAPMGEEIRISSMCGGSTYVTIFEHARKFSRKTKTPFVFNKFVRAVPYASLNRDPKDIHGLCTISGFGEIAENKQSDALLVGYTEIIPTRHCMRFLRKKMNELYCTSNTPAEVSKGDSGGPLVCKGTDDPKDNGSGVLVGVTSGYATINIDGIFIMGSAVFTRVSVHKKFLNDNDCSFKIHKSALFSLSVLVLLKSLFFTCLN